MRTQFKTAFAAGLMALAAGAQADVVTDWNTRVTDLINEARMGTPPAYRVMAYVQTSVRDAVEAASLRGASVDAAVAAANRTALARLMPAQEPAITAAFQAATAAIPDSPAKAAGLDAGEKAAAAVFASRGDDGAATPERYRPHAHPGEYVPTATPAVPQWPGRKTWLLDRVDQFRPAQPPALTSVAWARDYNEVKAIGSRNSTQRSAEQTEMARFWEFSLPSIYYGVVRSVATAPGRDVARNARLLATTAQAMDDALIAVLEAKYHYNFWRPVTAIRNGDQDGNAGTDRDAGWTPLIDNPLHPEYPSAHSILASTVATILQADLGRSPAPALATTSPTVKGVTRRWTRLDDFVGEVAVARVYEGIHYRFSTEVGVAMGKQIGTHAVVRAQQAGH